MEALTEEVRRLAGTGDEKTRKNILDSLSALSASIESPDDTVQRFTFYNMQLAAIRIGIDLNLFELLSKYEHPLTVNQLSEKTGANPVFMGRLLRYLASNYSVEEVDKDTFTASNISKTFAQPGFQAGVGHLFNNAGPCIQEWPAFMKENNYPDITDNTKTPFNKVMNTDLPAFIWMQYHPQNLAFFNEHMIANRAGMPIFLDVFPVLEKATGLNPERALFVDIGGGFGHQCIAFKQRYPQLEGRVIVQDLALTTANAVEYPGVEAMAYDFFTPQPVKADWLKIGAKFYYLRNIFHDWPDDKCREILKNIVDAMAPDSYILIDDMVLPNAGVHWQQAQLDMLMMVALGARERTQEQWGQLIEGAGLKIGAVHTYTASLKDSILEVVAA
ncbi:S-adenosyl-L-methionine-dependent methyltransferase [Aspergillus ellipticus CBS 707.79]|uniref:S-adenosyl-L-methionine-dependent methyltransferase n=1 Tax=Aspergillus ellipticus CBS 707.79 TaxID=1448320 RepID=A0A319CXE1_9EURO|nr:S-adenosyl-L-methionine-dependent methyltransferase [Aspergillus ellipticus CBS 707.79]